MDMNNPQNPYPYASGEHLAFELQSRFGERESAFLLWSIAKHSDLSVVKFLSDLLDEFGIEVSQFTAKYLDSFETMPPISEMTRERVLLAFLDFNEETDSDLKRFKEWDEYE